MSENNKEYSKVISDSTISKIHDLTGDGKKLKGLLMIYLSEEGSPVVVDKSSSQAAELSIRKAAEIYLDSVKSRDLIIDNEEDIDFFGEEDE